jgi:hypothetical protein
MLTELRALFASAATAVSSTCMTPGARFETQASTPIKSDRSVFWWKGRNVTTVTLAPLSDV